MIIYEYATCNRCLKHYKGKFHWKASGEIVCDNCEEKKEYNTLAVKKTEINNNKTLEKIVKDLITKDVKRIYIPRSVANNQQNIDYLRDETGQIDPKALYFYNNPIDIVLKIHQAVYILLQYIDTGSQEYEDFAESIIEEYLLMRRKKFTTEELDRLQEKIYSETFYEIVNMVNRL